MSERTGRNVLTALKRAGWITRVPSTDRRQEPVAIAVPLLALPAVIPDLFPTSALDGLERILGIV